MPILRDANKLKNLTINSSADAKTQIGEGCELVNGIVGSGCRIFYGVKAVRFIMAQQFATEVWRQVDQLLPGRQLDYLLLWKF